MSAKIELIAESRSDTGKRASRRIRKTDKVLATVYGASKDPAAIMLDHNKVTKALENESFYSSILTLKLNNESEKVVVKAIQRHPSKPRIMHMDFFRINPNEKLNMHIPLHFLGEAAAPGVKAGGVVSHFMNEVEVRCLPADLPEFIEVDVSNLEMDQSLHLADLQLPPNVEIVALTHDDNKPVVNVHAPHIIQEPIEETAPVSPEVEATRVSAVKPEEGAEAGKESKGKKE